MAQIVKRTTAHGTDRYDVRTRISGRVVTRRSLGRKMPSGTPTPSRQTSCEALWLTLELAVYPSPSMQEHGWRVELTSDPPPGPSISTCWTATSSRRWGSSQSALCPHRPFGAGT
jgi:hypothetical protein